MATSKVRQYRLPNTPRALADHMKLMHDRSLRAALISHRYTAGTKTANLYWDKHLGYEAQFLAAHDKLVSMLDKERSND